VQIHDIKVLHQHLSVFQVGDQIGIIAATLPFDLLDDELGDAFHEQLPDPKGQSCTWPKYKGIVFCDVVGRFEVKMHHVLELLPVWSEEQISRTAPCFCEEPSKKRVQWGTVNTKVRGSGALSSSPPGWLAGGLHSTMKSAST
jgi:hypothetical protein